MRPRSWWHRIAADHIAILLDDPLEHVIGFDIEYNGGTALIALRLR